MRIDKNFSQSTEQDIILKYFGDEVLTFLDLGSNDGITLSNTYALTLLGWSGYCVDASPRAFEKLSALHKDNDKITCINVGVGNECGKMTLYESGSHLTNEDVSLLSSLVKEETKRWAGVNFTPVEVEVVDMKTLLKALPDTIDFISIDCEGLDLDIIRQIDFKVLKTKLVCVEWNGKDKWAFDHVMLSQGFELIHTTPENLIYAVPK